MAKYSLTPRVKLLAERLLSQNSTISTERAAILETLSADVSGMPQLVKNARLFNELVKQLPSYIGQDELIIGSQSSVPRAAPFHSENALNSPSAFNALGQGSIASPDYMSVINKGLLAIEAEMEDRVKSIGSAISRTALDETNQCRAMIFACNAAMHPANQRQNGSWV